MTHIVIIEHLCYIYFGNNKWSSIGQNTEKRKWVSNIDIKLL